MTTPASTAAVRESPRAGWLRRLGLVVMAFLLLSTAGCSAAGDDSTEVTAYLADSAGLFVGNDVGILGVPVGTITAIEPEGEQVAVTMRVDGEHKIPADAAAAVVARSVATDRYVELTPVYRDGPTLQDGDEIPLERTRTPVDFDDVLESLNTFATGIAGSEETTQAVKEFIDSGAEALRGKGPLLNQGISSLAEATNGVHSQRETFASTVKSLDVLMAAIAEDERVARRFIKQVSRASELLASERKNFRTTLRSLNSAVTVVAEFAVDNRKAIVETLDGSTELMNTVLAKQGRLAEILRVMPLALQNVQRAGEGGVLDVVLNPLLFFPGGSILEQLCDTLPPLICGIIGTEQ
jgi:phospholipid/cholesterol/gamma-HCH transport system substrate-binding protein